MGTCLGEHCLGERVAWLLSQTKEVLRSLRSERNRLPSLPLLQVTTIKIETKTRARCGTQEMLRRHRKPILWHLPLGPGTSINDPSLGKWNKNQGGAHGKESLSQELPSPPQVVYLNLLRPEFPYRDLWSNPIPVRNANMYELYSLHISPYRIWQEVHRPVFWLASLWSSSSLWGRRHRVFWPDYNYKAGRYRMGCGFPVSESQHHIHLHWCKHISRSSNADTETGKTTVSRKLSVSELEMATSHLCLTPHPEKIPVHLFISYGSTAFPEHLPIIIHLLLVGLPATSVFRQITSCTNWLKILTPCSLWRGNVREKWGQWLLTLLSAESPHKTSHCMGNVWWTSTVLGSSSVIRAG